MISVRILIYTWLRVVVQLCLVESGKMIKSLTIASDESKCDMTLKDILARRDEVFKDEIGCVKGIKAKLHLKQNAVPKFVKARSVEFALRPKVEQELDKLEKQNIRVITKLPNSEQSYKGKVKTHKHINRQNQSTTGKL